MRRAALLAGLVLLAAAPAAAAEQRLVTIDTPSRNVDPATVVFNPGGAMKANVILPDGYDRDRKRRWPVLFLLHGAGDTYRGWVDKGRALAVTKDFPAIVVMPDAARGFYLNWWRGGRRGSPGWERFFLDELIPLVEKRFRVRSGRRWHAVAGVSMGALGAAYLAGQKPGYFGNAALFSGFLDPDRPEIHNFVSAIIPEATFTDIWGPPGGFYAVGHDPTRIPRNLSNTRMYVTVGDGSTKLGSGDSLPVTIVGGIAEVGVVRPQVRAFVGANRKAGNDVTFVERAGLHEWPYYWSHDLADAIRWDLFKPAVTKPSRWTTSTTADRGELWDLRYRFAAPPEGLVTFERRDGRLSIAGPPGARVTVRRAKGCAVNRVLPSDARLPAARKCRRKRR